MWLFPPSVVAIATVVGTSSTTAATQPSTMRHIVRTSEGTLHTFVQMGTNTTTCGSGGLWRLYSTDSGATWNCGSQLSSDTSNLMYADARTDSSDNIYLVYSVAGSGGNANYDVTYRKLTASSCSPAPCDWTVESAQTVLDADASGDNAGFHYATIELQGTTRAWVAVREYDGTNYQVGVYYSDSLAAAPTWTESQATLDTAGTNSSYHFPTIVRFGTNIGIIWNDQATGDIYWRYRADGDGLTSWNTAAQIANRLTRFPTFSAVGDSTGNIYLAVQDSSVAFYHYLSSWSSGATVASPSVADQFTSVSTDGTNVYVVYGDTTGITGGVNRKLTYKKGVPPFATGNFDTNPTALVSYHDIFDKVWLYDASADTYEEETTDSGNTTAADIAHSNSATIVKDTGDIIYMGKSTTFDAMSWVPSTVSVGGTNSWQYCSAVDATPTCTTWTPITFTVQQNQGWKGNGYGSFTPPSDWQASKVNGESTAYYYVRDLTTGDYTVGPIGTQLTTIPLPIWPSLAASTNGVYAVWTENASSPMKVRYATILSFNTNPNVPASLGGHVSGAFTSDSTPTLTFTLSDTDSADTVKYRIQIDDSSDFGSVVSDYTSALAAQGATSFTVGQAAGSGSYATGTSGQTLTDGNYYWRVKAIDDDAAESAYTTANSGAIAFQVDATVSTTPGTPSTASLATDTTPAWEWTASADSGSGLASTPYTLQWSQSAGFTSGISSTTSTTNSFTHTTALSDGTWYFRVKAADAAGNESSYSSAGSITVDATSPAAVDLTDPGDNSYTSHERPAFKWKTTTDQTAGLSKYVLEIDNPGIGLSEPSGDFIIDNIPVSRTTDYEASRYVIRYENFSDADDSNNYISVTTKSHSQWTTGENDGKLREGKVHWKVKAVDSAGNEVSSSRTVFVDKTVPKAEFTQVNDIPFSSGSFLTTDKTPTLYGKLTDTLSGGDSSQIQAASGPKIASGPKSADIKVEQKAGVGYKLHTLYTINMDKPWYSCSDKEVADNAGQACDKYLPFVFTSPTVLEPGTYRITVTGKDKADNASGEITLTLRITTLERITSPEEKTVIEEETKPLTSQQKDKIMDELEITKAIEPSIQEKVQAQISQTSKTIVQEAVNVMAGITDGMGQSAQFAMDTIKRSGAVIGDTTGRTLTFLRMTAGVGSGIYRHSRSLTTSWLQASGNGINSINQGLLGTGDVIGRSIANQYNLVMSKAPKGADIIMMGLGNMVSSTQETVQKAAIATGVLIHDAKVVTAGVTERMAVTAKMNISNIAFEAGKQIQDISDTAGFAIVNFGYRFINEPTRITDVKVTKLDATSATISWTTNHPANGKVNYGTSLDYGLDVQSEKRVNRHEFTITDLKPGTTYFYEVMSHNNNYVYDAHHSFTTPEN